MLATMTRRPALGGALIAAVAIALLGGCATPNDLAPSTSPPTASSAPSASPDPSPTPSAAPAATCNTVLAAEGYQKLADDGLELRPAPRAFDALAVRMVEAGGVACTWGKPNTDIALTVVQVGVTPLDDAWTVALAETGYVLTDDPVAGAHSGPAEPGSGISPVAVLTDGTLTFVSTPTFATMLAPAA